MRLYFLFVAAVMEAGLLWSMFTGPKPTPGAVFFCMVTVVACLFWSHVAEIWQ